MEKQNLVGDGVPRPQTEFARAVMAKREPGSQNVFERAMESREFINNSEEMKPLVKLRRNTSIAAVTGFVAVGVGTFVGLNKARPSFIHGKWVTAISLGAGVVGGYFVSMVTAREGIRQLQLDKAAREKEAREQEVAGVTMLKD